MKLRIHHPTIRGLTVTLGTLGLTVGRKGGDVDLEMNWDHRVSRRHLRIWLDEGVAWVEDLGSQNGVWIDAERIEAARPLAAPVVLKVGESTITVLRDADVQVPDLATAAFPVMKPAPAPTPRAVEITQPAREEVPDSGSIDLIELLPPDTFDPPAEPTCLETVEMALPVEAVGAALRSLTGAAKAPARAEAHLAGGLVTIEVRSPAALRPLWEDTISKGGLFVRTHAPPRLGTKLQVVLDAGGDELELSAEVVHVVLPNAAAPSQEPGAGLQLLNLSPPMREAIRLYVDGVASRLVVRAPTEHHAPRATAPSAEAKAQTLERALHCARELIEASEAKNLYEVLEVDSGAPGWMLMDRIRELRALLADGGALASPPQVARIEAAERYLDRATRFFSDPERRIEYDFRLGLVRAAERIEQARAHSGPSVAELRNLWHRAVPGNTARTLSLTREAVAAKQGRDLAAAIRLGQAALDLDPFNEELRSTVDAWRSQAGAPPTDRQRT